MEELRSKHKTIQSAAHHIALECIHPQSRPQSVRHKRLFTVPFVVCLCSEQSTHGSPYHVHPYPSPVRLQHAFQSQNSPKMFHPKGLKSHLEGRGTPTDSPVVGRALCLTPRGSPLPGRVSHLSDKFQDSLTLTADTDALLAKISAMFPTVSETHIKILLKKYYNREAVVISALQVEKHPITTPGPVSMSPAASRLPRVANAVHSAVHLAKGSSVHGSAHFTPYTGTPHDSPCLFRPASGASGASSYGAGRSVEGQRHQSPKMKLKYMKSIFPKAEETLILDVLANKDNNVQKASEELLSMGFSKKETPIPAPKKEKETPQPPKKVVTIMRTMEEKNQLKQKLQGKYPSIAERVISIALESVEYNEDRAEQILSAVLTDEDPRPTTANRPTVQRPSTAQPTTGPAAAEQPPAPARSRAAPPPPAPAARRLKSWADRLKPILKMGGGGETKYKSAYWSGASGPNPAMRQGPKDSLLLLDYLPWTGPNPEYSTGSTVKAEGPEHHDKPACHARGPASVAKGPAGLAKGSIYQKMNKKTAKLEVFSN